jgi:hypothetical protein
VDGITHLGALSAQCGRDTVLQNKHRHSGK